jgi:hypothetical protein
MLMRHVQRATFLLTAIMVAVLFFVVGAALRLAMGPISLGAFSRPVEDALNHSVAGAVIRFDDLVLEWSRPDNRINLIVLGTRIFDSSGHIIAQAPKADLDFDALALASGHLRLKSLGLIGLQLTGVRTEDGSFRLGLGRDQSQANFLDTLRQLLGSSASTERALQSISLQHARVAFLDQPTGLFLVLPDASLSMTTSKLGFDASITASAEISGSPFRVIARAMLREDGMPASAEFAVTGFSVRALAENNPRLVTFKPFALLTNISGALSWDNNGEITETRFRASGSGSIDASLLGSELRLRRFDLQASFNPQQRQVTADSITIQSSRGSFHGKGGFKLAWDESGVTNIAADLQSDNLALQLPRIYDRPLAFSRFAAHVDYSRDERQIQWQHASFTTGTVTGSLEGKARLGDSGLQNISLNGSVADMAVADLLSYWPATVAKGARDWVTANIPEGRVGPLQFNAALDANALDASFLPDDALEVVFPLHGLTTRYVPGMTPITSADGVATLRGDSFRVRVDKGSIGPLALSAGDVSIPELHTPGTTAHIVAHAEGTTADVLRLIDEPPLGYPKRFGIVPGTVEGRSAVDLQFDLPLLKDLTWDRVQFAVKANSTQLGLPVAQRKLDGATVQFDVNPASLTAKGDGRYAAVPVTFQWTEEFGALAKSTRLDVSGQADDAGRMRLGITLPNWISGRIPFSVTLSGHHFQFTDGTVKADLTAVSADFPGLAMKKPAGKAATGSAQFSFDPAGVVSLPDFSVSGEDLLIHGALMMREGGRVRSLSLSQFRYGPDDFALTLIPSDRGFSISVLGQSLDVRHFTGLDGTASSASDREASPLQDALLAKAQVQRLIISQRATLRDATVGIAFGAGGQLNTLALDATGQSAEKVTGHLAIVKGVRTLEIDSDNAGAFVTDLFDFSSIRGGRLNAEVFLPEQNLQNARKPGPAPDHEGILSFSDITLTNQPFLARLFAAGSLEGPLRLLQGEGITLSKAAVPFTMRGRVIMIDDGRASGDAIGGTFAGSYDRDSRKVDISGTLVPIYGLNSMLGTLPVLGDLLVSKQGEGILGLTYEMKGDINEPGVAVNPLSLFTPGILRRIFEFGSSRGAEVSAAPKN